MNALGTTIRDVCVLTFAMVTVAGGAGAQECAYDLALETVELRKQSIRS